MQGNHHQCVELRGKHQVWWMSDSLNSLLALYSHTRTCYMYPPAEILTQFVEQL